ncbi:hypothetical protein ABGB07_23550 [Micromonosporaceae bacterium B7E4]
MARYLLASTPVHGHVTPMTNIAAALVRAGHQVRFLTGAHFRETVEAAGGQHVALPAAVDYDARDLDAAFPGRTKRSGLRKLTFDVQHTFIEPMRAQAEAMRAMLDAEPVDAILAETAFLGVLPLLVDPRPRPPVVGVGITVLPLLSRDTAPFGLGLPPSSSAAGRVRNWLLNLLVRRIAGAHAIWRCPAARATGRSRPADRSGCRAAARRGGPRRGLVRGSLRRPDRSGPSASSGWRRRRRCPRRVPASWSSGRRSRRAC